MGRKVKKGRKAGKRRKRKRKARSDEGGLLTGIFHWLFPTSSPPRKRQKLNSDHCENVERVNESEEVGENASDGCSTEATSGPVDSDSKEPSRFDDDNAIAADIDCEPIDWYEGTQFNDFIKGEEVPAFREILAANSARDNSVTGGVARAFREIMAADSARGTYFNCDPSLVDGNQNISVKDIFDLIVNNRPITGAISSSGRVATESIDDCQVNTTDILRRPPDSFPASEQQKDGAA